MVLAAAPSAAEAPWQWPVEPARVVHEFDPPDNPYGAGHRGVDLAVSVGQAVVAPADGTVTFAGVIAGRGVVVVSHGDVRTTYEPVVGEAAVGTVVDAGEVIATVQPFAFHCTSPCLHWGARRGDTYVDPTSFVVPGPSRLLPLWAGGTRAGAGVGAGARGGAANADQAVAAGGLTDSPGAGHSEGVEAGVGALEAYRHPVLGPPPEIGGVPATTGAAVNGATALLSPGSAAADGELARIVTVASGLLLAGAGWLRMTRRT